MSVCLFVVCLPTWNEMVTAEMISMAILSLESLSGMKAVSRWCRPNRGTRTPAERERE